MSNQTTLAAYLTGIVIKTIIFFYVALFRTLLFLIIIVFNILKALVRAICRLFSR